MARSQTQMSQNKGEYNFDCVVPRAQFKLKTHLGGNNLSIIPTKHINVELLQLISPIGNEESLMPEYEELDKLKRSRCDARPKSFKNCRVKHLNNSFLRPLKLMCFLLESGGNEKASYQIAITYKSTMQRFHKSGRDKKYVDDYIRKTFSMLSSSLVAKASNNASETDVNNMLLFSGIENVGGPTSWTQESIIAKAEEWVTGKTTLFENNKEWVSRKLDFWFDQWFLELKTDAIDFEEYCKDLSRWGTSGGITIPSNLKNVYKSLFTKEFKETDKNRLRNKNIIGLLCLQKYGNLNKLLQNDRFRVTVALKEETKTRLVASTPFPAYIEQSYMLFKLGKPKWLKSTISDSKLLNDVITKLHCKYWAIDSSKFDHNVPKWLLIMFWHKLKIRFDAYGDGVCSTFCDNQINDLNNIYIEIFDKKIKYEKGLLSGWRVTSIIGSMISALICEHVLDTTAQNVGQFSYITQGDDILFWSTSETQPTFDVLKEITSIGVTINKDKCLIGKDADFLKYIYTRDSILGFVGRSIRSIFYANPWIDNVHPSSLQELVTSWFTLTSRISFFVPNKQKLLFNVKKLIIEDAHRWNRKLSSSTLAKLLITPSSIGGLGVVETWESSNVYAKIVDFVGEGQGSTPLLRAFGFSPLQENKISQSRVMEFKFKPRYTNIPILNSNEITDHKVNIFRSVIETTAQVTKNKTIVMLADKLRKNSKPETTVDLKCMLPRVYRKTGRTFYVLTTLLGSEKTFTMPQSLFLEPVYDRNRLDMIRKNLVMAVRNAKDKPSLLYDELNHYFTVRSLETYCIHHSW